MPIGDLLASITGEKPKSSPVPPKTSLPSKRKAEDDDSKNRAQKSQRTASSTDVRSFPAPGKGDGAAHLPVAKSVPRPASDSTRSSSGNGATRPVSSQPLRPRLVPATGGRVSSHQSPDSPAMAKSAPKKGSFAEIMARAVKAQQSMGQVGKIQHKPLDKVPPKRDRADNKADGSRDPRRTGKGQATLSAASQRGGMNGGSAAKNGDRNTDSGRSPGSQASRSGANGKKEAAPAPEVKKPKKAAVATTGYQGTARPPPGASSKRGPGAAASASNSARNGADHRRLMPFGGARSRGRRNDEMDDFIDDGEDDPEESGYRPHQYRYASDEDESDMEAGLSDIDEEEREAEILGRREDREQEALEQRLKREKEERKRRFMQAAAAKRR